MTSSSSARAEQIREMYYRFGVAVYDAQVLEYTLLNVLALLRGLDGEFASPTDFDRAYGKDAGLTLGPLIARVESRFDTVPDYASQLLTEALEIRNTLAHRFFREREEDFLSAERTQEMIDELGSMSATLRKAGALGLLLQVELANQAGVDTAEAARAAADKTIEALNTFNKIIQ